MIVMRDDDLYLYMMMYAYDDDHPSSKSLLTNLSHGVGIEVSDTRDDLKSTSFLEWPQDLLGGYCKRVSMCV